ncbi:hypothetical protein C0Q70_20318 [Pomacea canaliculata]|uniref:Uncharacterized protein n=2 Tax=Pomacea canaliculata TaxID=400727 RepID=A0A2T7NF63_POMCA|nr:hypothetical protein C0Q70_20318 [Pomacea canaliculata]
MEAGEPQRLSGGGYVVRIQQFHGLLHGAQAARTRLGNRGPQSDHRLPHAWWAEASREDIENEIVTQRHNLAQLADIPVTDIRGWRSPFLQPSGDNMFEVLYENNFTYDATMTYPFPRNVFSPVMWPFTLDYSYTLVCNIQPCPKQTYPGLWVIPVVVMMDYREHLPCAYVDHCTNEPRNQYESFEMLWKNFLRNYRTNRAPVYVNLHSVWLETDFHMEAMDEFIQRLLGMKDVYLLSVHKALEWVSHPTPLSRIMDFKPWQCDFTPNQEDKEFCSFTFRPIKSTTTRRTTTTSRTRYHNTAEDQDNDIDDEEDRDHNGFAKENMEDNRGKGHRHHAHRPWFLRGTAVSSLPPVEVILLLAGLSVLMFVST